MNRVYKHSGGLTFTGTVASIVAGLAAGFPLALIYAWGIIQIPEEKLACLVTLVYGALIGGAVALAAKWGKVRNLQIVGALAVCAAALSFYCSWAFWIKDIYHNLGQAELDAFTLMQRPNVLWDLIKLVNQYGTWGTTAGNPTKGTELWLIWACEALAVPGAAAVTAVTILAAQPFCEPCQEWCSASEKIYLLPVSDPHQVKLAVQQRDFSFLQKLGPGNKKTSHLLAELHSCPNCRGLNTLTLKQTLFQRRKLGSLNVKHVTLLDKLLVSRPEADLFRHTAQGLKQLSNAAHA